MRLSWKLPLRLTPLSKLASLLRKRRGRYYYLIVGSIFLVAGIAALTITLNTKKAEAAWYNDSWNYREPITITNSGSSTLYNLQEEFSINTSTLVTASKMQSSCNDMRFTNKAGKLLPFYIDSGCNTTTTKVWVLVDQIIPSTSVVYMYYGNPSASQGSTTVGFDNVRGLVGYWTLNEASGNNAADSTVNANTEVVDSGNPSVVTGIFGNARLFGTNDEFSRADSAAFDPASAVTVEIWEKPAVTTQSNLVIVSKRVHSNSDPYNSYAINTDGTTGTHFVFCASNGTPGTQVCTVATSVMTTNWTHVVGVYDGANVNIYINGKFESKAAMTGSIGYDSNSLYFNGTGGGGTLFQGTLDDVRIYNNARSASQITNDYNMVPSYTISTATTIPTASVGTEDVGPGPNGYWAFDDGYGTTANDSSSGRNNGTLGGFSLVAHLGQGSTDTNGFTTTAINTTGANLLIVEISSAGATTFTDNYNNTWTQAVQANNGNSSTIYYALNPKVGSGQTFILTGTNTSPTIFVSAWSGANIVSPLDKINSATALNTTTIQAGSITPSQSNELVIGCMAYSSTAHAATIDSSFQITDTMAQVNSNHVGGGCGYIVQTSPAVTNPTWSDGGDAQFNNATIASFISISSPTWQTEDQCISGKCLLFNGANQAVSVASVSGQVQSISFWAKPATSSASFLRLNRDADIYATSGTVNTDNITSPTIYVNGVVNGTLNANQWNHIEVTTPNGIIAGSPLLGMLWRGVLNGYMDEVKVYPYVRTSSQVYADFNARGTKQGGSAVLGSNASNNTNALNNGLVGYWKMNESTSAHSGVGYNGTSGEAVDSSGNSNNGTFTGTKGLGDTTATSGTANTITKTAAGWTVNGFTNMAITIASGTGVGQVRTISSNTATVITVSSNWTTNPDSTSHFTISDMGTGKFGNGGAFNGVDDYVDAGTGPVLSGSWSLSTWVKTAASLPSGDATILGRAGPGSGFLQNYQLTYNFSLTAFSVHSDADNYNQTAHSTDTLQTNTWYFLVGTYNSNTNTYTIYVNGVPEATYKATGLPSTSGAQTLQIGAANSSSSPANFWTGLIDEARVYSRALSPADVTALYNFAPGPVAYYNFEEGSGSSVNDTSGNANTGTWQGTLGSQWKSGKYGKAGNFNGTNNSVQVTGLLGSPGAITLSGWVNLTTVGSSGSDMISLGDNVGIRLDQNGGKGISAFYYKGGASWNEIDSNTFIAGTGWHHVAYTVDPAASKQVIYLDGVAIKTGSSTELAAYANGSNTFIGRHANGSGSFFLGGKVDDVKIYNYARTAKQVVQDMNAGHPAGGSPVGSMVGHWDFDEGYGTTAHNTGSAGDGLAGTLTNMASPSLITSGWQQAGKFGKALGFDGTNDYVDMGKPSALNLSGDMSISVWVNPSNISAAAAKDVIANYESTGNTAEYELYLTHNNVDFDWGNSGNYNDWQAQGYTFTPNKWYHIVAVRTGLTAAIYINGVSQTLTQIGSPGGSSTTVPTSGFGNTAVGRAGSFNGQYYAGSIDEVKVYSYPLTADEVKIDYNHGASQAFGSLGTNTSDGKTASNSAGAAYCIPGDTSTCNAPVGEWNFEEGVGTTVNDTSGNGNTGTWNGTGTAHWTRGKVGKAGNFNGSDDYVSTGGRALNTTGNFTVQAWINTNSFANYQTIVSEIGNDNAVGEFGFRITQTTGTLAFYRRFGGSTSIYFLTTNAVLQKNKWYFVTAVYSGSDTNLTIYINGLADSATSISSSYGASSGVLTRIGMSDANAYPFSGQIDQAKIYNYARSAAQVAYDYNRGGPVMYYDFDECQGTVLHDMSGNGSNGTITIGASVSQTAPGTCTDGLSTSAWNNGKVGKYNSSLSFDGTDDYVSMTNNLPSITQQASVCAWFKTSDSGTRTIFAQNNGAGTANIDLEINGDGSHAGLVGIGVWNGSNIPEAYSKTTVSTGNWVFGCGTRNGATMTIFVNGNQENQISNGNTDNVGNTTGYIGQNGKSANWFNGQIDDVRVFNYVLTLSQIQTLYNQGSAVRFGPVTGSP